MAQRQASGSGSRSGHGFGQPPDMERQRCTTPAPLLRAPASTPASVYALTPTSVSALASAPASASASNSAPAPAPASSPLQRQPFLRPPPPSPASSFPISASASAAALPTAQRRAPRQRRFSPSAIYYSSSTTVSASISASAYTPLFSTAAAAAAIGSSALSSASSSLALGARPILPPLPRQGPSPPGRSSSPRHHSSTFHFSSSTPTSLPAHLSANANANANAAAIAAVPLALATLHPDPYSPLNTTLNSRFPPLLIAPQSTAFWSSFGGQIDQQNNWSQHAPASDISVIAARAFGLNFPFDNASMNQFPLSSSLAPFTSQPPFLQSPSQPPQRPRPDLHFPFDFGALPAPASASASSLPSASASASALASTSTPVPAPAPPAAISTSNPSSRRLHQSGSVRPNTSQTLLGSSLSATTRNPVSPPTSGQPAAPLQTPAEASFDSGIDIATLRRVFDSFERFTDFSLPVAESTDTSFSSVSDAMPPASTARRRTLRSQAAAPPEAQDDSTSATHASKRQRVMPSAAEPTASLQTVMDDDDSLFASSPPRSGSSSGLKNEEFTTIDLTEATEVPDELKKPEVDNRVKLSAFQCVICMDDVTGLTLTHCGHLFCAQCLYSSLSIESTRGKCPMCRAKIDMKPRENYSTKTRGYWPLELKLMTKSRQGKRKAQAMA